MSPHAAFSQIHFHPWAYRFFFSASTAYGFFWLHIKLFYTDACTSTWACTLIIMINPNSTLPYKATVCVFIFHHFFGFFIFIYMSMWLLLPVIICHDYLWQCSYTWLNIYTILRKYGIGERIWKEQYIQTYGVTNVTNTPTKE